LGTVRRTWGKTNRKVEGIQSVLEGQLGSGYPNGTQNSDPNPDVVMRRGDEAKVGIRSKGQSAGRENLYGMFT
jgi:hypothetical protein